MILGLRDWMGIHPLWALVILGAESSLGDPDQGGPLARAFNFGCMKAAVKGPWSELANGTVTVRDVEWHTFPDAATGMEAWGLYITQGMSGVYPAFLERGDWRGFGLIYYGAHVAGLEAYVASLYERAAGIRAKAKAAGFDW